jgi:hypothetical protein
MLIPTILIGVIVLVSMTGAFLKYRDTFHPAMLMCPMIGFHYFYAPLVLQFNNGFFGYLTEQQVTRAQWIHLAGVAALCVGFFLGPLHTRTPQQAAGDITKRYDSKTLLNASLLFAALGITSFIYGIENVGGWSEAYGVAYGGGWIDSGWLRDLVLLCIPALMLFTLGQGDRPMSRRQLTLALPMISPFLIHGLIGARRGPTFMAFAGAAMVFYLARRRRPRLMTLLVGGGALGILMLVLVNNRNSIYWGSNLEVVETETSGYLRNAEGSDYIYGTGLIIITDEMQDFSWGTTYLTTLLVRPIPRSIWPTKYEDAALFFGRPILTENLGIDITVFRNVLGWTASLGAAPGIIGDMWREFSWGMVFVLMGLTWFYSYTWWRAISTGGGWVPIYSFAASLSLYLIMQTLEAMLYRFLFGVVPMMVVLRLAEKKARQKAQAVPTPEPETGTAAVSTVVASS